MALALALVLGVADMANGHHMMVEVEVDIEELLDAKDEACLWEM